MDPNTKMDVDEAAIDEGLYSRQLCVDLYFLAPSSNAHFAPVMCWAMKVDRSFILVAPCLMNVSDEEDGSLECVDRGTQGIGR